MQSQLRPSSQLKHLIKRDTIQENLKDTATLANNSLEYPTNSKTNLGKRQIKNSELYLIKMAKQVRKLQIEIERGLKQTEEVSLFNSYSFLGRRTAPAAGDKDRISNFIGNEGKG